MANADLGRLIEHLDRLTAEPDERLLARFIATRDEESFAAIVRRHGPMVLGVCRRLLRHRQDAEDAFQATFIILARRASAVVKRTALASWLYGVACRTARQARGVNARRQAREKQVDPMPHPAADAEGPQDWRPLLDEELARLPEKYRTAILLCELEGRPRRDAAALLGIPEGTLSSRLATARRMLAARLSDRGLSLTGAALAAALAADAASAAVPAALLKATSKAAVLAAAGQLATDATAASVLTHEVMKAMFMTKLKMTVAALAVTVVFGVTGIATRFSGVPAAHAQPAAAEKKASNELEALRRENELLKLNLRVTLEKLDALEKQKGEAAWKKEWTDPAPAGGMPSRFSPKLAGDYVFPLARAAEAAAEAKLAEAKAAEAAAKAAKAATADAAAENVAARVEAAAKALREAKDAATRLKVLKALEEAIRELQPDKSDLNVKPTGSGR